MQYTYISRIIFISRAYIIAGRAISPLLKINGDDAMAMARADFRWFDQFALSLDPEHAYSVWAKQMGDECSKKHDMAFCSMCGPRFCPIRLNKKLKAAYNEQ